MDIDYGDINDTGCESSNFFQRKRDMFVWHAFEHSPEEKKLIVTDAAVEEQTKKRYSL